MSPVFMFPSVFMCPGVSKESVSGLGGLLQQGQQINLQKYEVLHFEVRLICKQKAPQSSMSVMQQQETLRPMRGSIFK